MRGVSFYRWMVEGVGFGTQIPLRVVMSVEQRLTHPLPVNAFSLHNCYCRCSRAQMFFMHYHVSVRNTVEQAVLQRSHCIS